MKISYQTFSLPAIMCCSMLTCLAAPDAAADDDIWTGNGDGISFADPVNWSLGFVPGETDNAIFASLGGPITFSSDRRTSGLFVRNAIVDFRLGNATYQVSDLLLIGDQNGDIADLQLARGTVHVFDTDFDDLVLGFEGDGTMFIRATASLIVDGEALIGDAGDGDVIFRGTVSMRRCFVADDFRSFSDVVLEGAAASWDIATTLKAGNGGDGKVHVFSAASLTAGAIIVAHDLLSAGVVTIDGAGSSVTATGGLIVGNRGMGTVDVQNGGFAGAAMLFVGDDAGSEGQLTVQNSGSTLIISGTTKIGNSGVGSLAIANGAAATIGGNMAIGDDVGSGGQLTMQNPGSNLTIAGTTKIGNSGVGSLAIANGAAATIGGNMTIGDNPGSTGSCTVSGAGSSLACTATIFVGNFGTGDLTVDAGATLSSSGVKVSDEVGSTGSLTVSGPGSEWTDATEVIVGNFGAGQLTIVGGGSASSVISTIGDDPGSNGSATVDGAGSTWVSSARLRVGNFGSGALTIQNGGAVSASRVQLGFDRSSSGDVTVDAAGSTLSADTNIRNGLTGTGLLTIIGGAQVDAGGSYIQEANGDLQTVLNANTITMISATKAADLAGGLTVTLATGFSPPPGTEFTLVSAPAVNGVFTSVSLPPNFEIIYDADSVRVRAGGPGGTPATLTDLTMIDGIIVSGGLPELESSDDMYLETEAKVTGEAAETHRMRMRIGATTTVQNPDTLDITLEAHITDIEAIVTVFLRNWNNGNFEQVGQFTNGIGNDTTNTVNVPNASRFVRNDGRIELLLKKIVILPFTLNGFHSLEDLLEIVVR